MTNDATRATAEALPTLTTPLLPDEFPAVYSLQCDGTCLEPLIKDGTRLLFSRDERYFPGDLVCLHVRPELVRPGDHQLLVKKLVIAPPHRFWTDPTCNAGSNIKPVVIVQTLNPQKTLYLKPEALLGIHKCLGPAEGRAAVKVSTADLKAAAAAGKGRAQ